MAIDDINPLISHLTELRKRLLYWVFNVLVVFLVLIYFANDIYQLIAAPLIKHKGNQHDRHCCGVAVLCANQTNYHCFGDHIRSVAAVPNMGIHRFRAV